MSPREVAAHPVALVTGAARGIGAAIAEDLASRGYAVVVNWARSEVAAQEVVKRIEGDGGIATAVKADVASEVEVRGMFRAVKNDYGRLDALVNNAGVNDDGLSMMMPLAKWQRVIDTNLTGTFLCCREGMKLMSYRGSGSIVNLSSISGILGNQGQANYAASKGAVNSLTKVLAREGAHSGIRVNAVAPGYIATDMTKVLSSEMIEKLLDRILLGRCGTGEEVARLVGFLVSDDASYITGQIIGVDGGLT